MSDLPETHFQLRSFSAVVAALEEGQLIDQLSDHLVELTAAVNNAVAEGAKAEGSLTLKLKMKAEKGVMVVAAEASVSLPKIPRGKTVLWATPDNHLTRANPSQRELPLRDATTETRETRNV